MNFELKPNYEKVQQRFEAFWERAVIDRALVSIALPKVRPDKPVPNKEFASHRERWLDIDYRVDELDARLSNTVFLGEALPIAWTNLGPETFSA